MREALADPECPCDITIVEGHRNQERQDRMVEEGKSQLRWPHSRHNLMPSISTNSLMGGALGLGSGLGCCSPVSVRVAFTCMHRG